MLELFDFISYTKHYNSEKYLIDYLSIPCKKTLYILKCHISYIHPIPDYVMYFGIYATRSYPGSTKYIIYTTVGEYAAIRCKNPHYTLYVNFVYHITYLTYNGIVFHINMDKRSFITFDLHGNVVLNSWDRECHLSLQNAKDLFKKMISTRNCYCKL